MKKRILCIAAILLLGSAIAVADDYVDALIASKNGNYAKAVELFRPLAAKGDANAQFNLGVMYDKGNGVAQNYQEAAKWHLLAAEQGHARAQVMLGAMYFVGKGVIQDFVRAHMWSNLAASNGSKEGNKGGAVIREIIAKMMTSAQIAKAQKMARECEEKKYKNCE